jgi:hypothetical protein
LRARPGAARVVRFGMTTFYQRAHRKLRLTDSAEIPASPGRLIEHDQTVQTGHRQGTQ